MEGLTLKAKNGSVFNNFTQAQLEELFANVVICLPDRSRLVTYSQTEPCNTCIPWQPTDGCGDPVGTVKTYDEDTSTWV